MLRLGRVRFGRSGELRFGDERCGMAGGVRCVQVRSGIGMAGKEKNMFKMLMTGNQAMQIVKDYVTKDIAHSNVTEAVLALENYIKSLEKSVK